MTSIAVEVAAAARRLRRTPALAWTIVATLALGVGANVAMLELVQDLLLTPPPGVRDPARLARVGSRGPGNSQPSFSMSFASLQEFQAAASDLEAITAGSGPRTVTIGAGENATAAAAGVVAARYFSTLGVVPTAGRFFTDDESSPRAASDVAILSNAYWVKKFGASRDILNHTILMNGRSYMIVGVAAKGFHGVGDLSTDLWVPLNSATQLFFGGSDEWIGGRGDWWLQVVGRLRLGITRLQAASKLSGQWTAWKVDPDSHQQRQPMIVLAGLTPGLGSNRPETE